ncbi:hypothetical protein N7E70_015780 [Aminobacter sp. NyZ550]|uniref:hypothetical protein n=1 Tax=Aminobacter sp. NyZ550 TaxID=2979870 RepID=UPI0021D5F2BF|nr:hypothetical protein [Aminobacter sp. NyZ550]WAX93157.1 hypothetical protein N7E70_015780 [Aminobacter sp. NyZ550]
MTDRPIIFSGPMVRALLAGTKTQTRRVMLPQPYALDGRPGYWNASGTVGGRICINDRALLDLHRKPKPGDHLYVREAWRTESRAYDDLAPSDMGGEETVIFEADADWKHHKTVGRLRQGMHMPRWASRLTLTVTEIRVQRLQEISEADAIAEGCVPDDASHNPNHIGPARSLFEGLWEGLNAARGYGWYTNPWVTATTFTVERRNIDEVRS